MSCSVTDLEDVIKTWGWSAYTMTKNGGLLSYNNAHIDVVWDKVHFASQQPKFSDIRPSDDIDAQIVFRSTFDNETGQSQNHNFQTQRSTMATATTKLSKGFTRGVNTGIKLPVPNEVLKATASFGNYVTIDCEEENTVQHDLTWSVNTTVKAPKGLRTIAELGIFEQKFECNFKMDVSCRGTVIVKISDLLSGRQLMVVQNDIATLIRDHFHKPDDGKKSVVLPLKGTAKFRYGISQRVRVYQEQLPPYR